MVDSSNYSGLHYRGGVYSEYLHTAIGNDVVDDWEVIKIERRKALEEVARIAAELVKALEVLDDE